MKSRRFKIKIQTLGQALQDFKRDWRAAERRHPGDEDSYNLVLSFPDISYLAKIFSPERMRIIQTIRTRQPQSIYQLARQLDRSFPNVQKDVHELASYGIIQLKKTRRKGQKRVSLCPTYQWDGFDIAV